MRAWTGPCTHRLALWDLLAIVGDSSLGRLVRAKRQLIETAMHGAGNAEWLQWALTRDTWHRKSRVHLQQGTRATPHSLLRLFLLLAPPDARDLFLPGFWGTKCKNWVLRHKFGFQALISGIRRCREGAIGLGRPRDTRRLRSALSPELSSSPTASTPHVWSCASPCHASLESTRLPLSVYAAFSSELQLPTWPSKQNTRDAKTVSPGQAFWTLGWPWRRGKGPLAHWAFVLSKRLSRTWCQRLGLASPLTRCCWMPLFRGWQSRHCHTRLSQLLPSQQAFGACHAAQTYRLRIKFTLAVLPNHAKA